MTDQSRRLLRVTLEKHGGFAGLRPSHFELELRALDPSVQDQVKRAVDAQLIQPAAPKLEQQGRDSTLYRITAEFEDGALEIQGSDASSPEFAQLVVLIEEEGQRKD